MNSPMRTALLSTMIAAACATSLSAMAQTAAKHDAMPGDTTALDVLATVDQDEIKAAKHALAKKVSGPVADYARMMERDHGDNLAATKKLLGKDEAAVKSAEADKVAKDNAATMAKLKSMEGKDFEHGYIDAMVDGHTKVLAKLDNELIPGAKDSAVKAHLQKTREAVAMHLDHAKQLQAAR